MGLALRQYIGTRLAKDVRKRSSWQDGEGLDTPSVLVIVALGLTGPFPLTSRKAAISLTQLLISFALRIPRWSRNEHWKSRRVYRPASKICPDPLPVVRFRSNLMLQGLFSWGDVNTIYPLFLRSQWQTKIWFHWNLPWGPKWVYWVYLHNMGVRVRFC